MRVRQQFVAMVLMAVLGLVLAGCGSTSGATDTSPVATSTPTASESTGTGQTQTNRTWSEVWNTGAATNEGDPVRLAGLVYQDAGGALLVYGDPDQRELPTQVSGAFPGVREDDYVLVRGTITGSDTYTSVAGGKIDVVTVDGDSVKKISRERALALANPATGGVRRLNLSQTQGGFTVLIKSIEWTSDSTRLNIVLTNHGAAKASLSLYDAVIQQGTRQFDLSDSDEGASELSDDIRPGVTKSGTLTFDLISKRRGRAYIAFDWLSDNFDIDTDQPFKFTMTWKP